MLAINQYLCTTAEIKLIEIQSWQTSVALVPYSILQTGLVPIANHISPLHLSSCTQILVRG